MTATTSSKVQIGTISEGTLRAADLLDAFGWELRRLGYAGIAMMEAHELLDMNEDAQDAAWEARAEECVSDLIEALEGYALPYTYFGTLEGDGADYGFWPDHAAIGEALRNGQQIDDEEHLTDDGYIISVSDHGNVSVMDGDRNLIWDCV